MKGFSLPEAARRRRRDGSGGRRAVRQARRTGRSGSRGAAQADGVTAAEALRLSAFVLSGELRLLRTDEDIARFAPESAAVRALRGFLRSSAAPPRRGSSSRHRRRAHTRPGQELVPALRADSAARPLPLTGTARAHAGRAAGRASASSCGCSARPRIRPGSAPAFEQRDARATRRAATAGAMAAGSP